MLPSPQNHDMREALSCYYLSHGSMRSRSVGGGVLSGTVDIPALPAKLEWGEVGWVAGLAFLVTLVMSVIPSMWAARLNPVEALRFE